MNYKYITYSLLAIGLIPQATHTIPSMNELFGRLKQIETPKISFAQAMPWMGAASVAGSGWGMWSWYTKRAQERSEKQLEIEKQKNAAIAAQVAAKAKSLEDRFQQLLNKPAIKNKYHRLLHAVIAGYIYKHKAYTSEFLEYVYNKIMAAHFADEKNNPSPLELINKRFKSTHKLPLQLAAEQANVEAVKWLLQKGANPKMKIRIKINDQIGLMNLSKLVTMAKNTTTDPDGIERNSKILSALTAIDVLDTGALTQDGIESLDFAQQCRDYYNKNL